ELPRHLAYRNPFGVNLVPNYCDQIHGHHPGRVTLALRWLSTAIAGGSASPGQVTHRCRDLRGVGQFLMAETGQFKMAEDRSDSHERLTGGRRTSRRSQTSARTTPYGS